MARNQYTVARRSIWYVLRSLLVLVLLVVLCLAVFIGAMHMSNIYVLVTEGLEKRAACILENGSPNELSEYFTEDFIAQDQALYAGTYEGYTVTNFIYKLAPESIFVLPWDTVASMRVSESLLSLSGSANEGTADTALPPWTPCRYTVKLRRIDGRWFISNLLLLEENPEQAPRPTPDMSLLPEGEKE